MKKKNKPTRVCGGHLENPLQQARGQAGVSQNQIAEELSCDIRTIQRRYFCEFADLFPEEFR